MTDRELLELAAKAAEMNVKNWHDDAGVYVKDPIEGSFYWNPLTDDGDALRLAVKLKLLIDGCSNCVQTMEQDHGWFYGESGDEYAKTRRAIVRAAAAIGKEMK